MSTSLDDLRRVADVEFGDIVVDDQSSHEKLRLFLVDSTFVDVWLSRRIPDRFGFHWERRSVDGTLFRYDNFPNTQWQHVSTFPHHFHKGSQDIVEPSPFSTDPLAAFREFVGFVRSHLRLAPGAV